VSGLSPQAETLLKAAAAYANDDGAAFISALKSHRWSDAAWLAATDGLKLAALAGVPYAGLAGALIPFARYAATHPHNTGEDGIGAPPEGNSNVVI
jgi:hypothetical protein